MRKWLNRLFYLICYFALAMVIYHLAMIPPPLPGEKGYLAFCIGAAGIAALCAGSAVGFAALAEWIERKGKSEESNDGNAT